MPLPNYNPRSDSFGNWYFGGFQMDSSVEAGYGAGTALTATQTQWETFLDSALGSANWTKAGTGISTDYYFRFANPWEPLTGAISTTANYRFSWMGSTLNDDIRLNTSVTGTPVNIARNGVTLSNMFDASTRCVFAVANQYSIWIASIQKGATGELSPTSPSAMYAGWVKSPVFPTGTTERVRNCVIGRGDSTGNSMACSRAESSTTMGLVSVNNPITCQVATPGANVTDAIAIDTNTSNLALGSLHNCLILPTALTIGRLYKIPSASDPDGNTEQNIWLCTGTSHFAFNGTTSAVATQSRLIRVWSNNIT